MSVSPSLSWSIGMLVCWAFVMAGLFLQPAVPVLIAVLGFFLTRIGMSRLTKDRWCVKLALWSYGLKITLALTLYLVSFYHWPLLREYQGERGFWVFSEDALAYHYHANNLVRAWNGLAPYPQTGISNWSFIVYMGLLYRAFGIQPLVVSCLNAWCGTVIVGSGLVMMQRWTLSPKAVRFGVALLGFWPSLLLWSSQSMKDPLLLALTFVGLCLLLELIRAQARDDRVFFGLAGLLGLLLSLLVLFRDYTAIQLGTVSSIMTAGLAIRWIRTGVYRLAIRLVAVAVLIPLVIVLAGQLDLHGLAVRPTLPDAVVTSPTTVTLFPVSEAVRSTPAPLSTAPEAVPLSLTGQPHAAASTALADKAHRHWWRGWVQLRVKDLDSRRQGFLSTGGHSLMDADVRFSKLSDVVRYLPKSLSLALLAPFPWQWFDVDGQTKAFRTLTALETLLMYVLLAGLLFRASQVRRYTSVQTVTVLLFIVVSAIPMGLVVANLGTLFRLRLQFLLPLMMLLCVVDVWSGYRQVLQQVAHCVQQLVRV